MDPVQIVILGMYLVVIIFFAFAVYQAKTLRSTKNQSPDELRLSELIRSAKLGNPGLPTAAALKILYNYKGEVLDRLDKDRKENTSLRQRLIKDRILIGGEMARLSREKIEIESGVTIPQMNFEP